MKLLKQSQVNQWIQVLANSAIATVLVIVLAIMTGGQDQCLDSNDSKVITGIIGAIIGHYCCCNGDTWSSEIGVLSDEQPRLITTLKPVRKGTNGGVTFQGLLAATGGGLTIGLTFTAVGLMTAKCSFDMALRQLLVIPISAAAGLLGSLIDSLLGATLEFSGYCSVRKKVVSKPGPTVTKISGMTILDNDAVNAISVLLTAAITAYVCICLF